MTSVLIVDDHPVVRDGLASVLGAQAEMRVGGSVGSAEAMLEALAAGGVDVVLLDLALPGMSGMEALARVSRAFPTLPVIVFSAHDDEDAMVEAVRSGARGYVVKGAPAAEIVGAVRTVAGGGSYFEARAAGALAAAVRTKRAPDALTRREREVIRLVGEGCSNKQIAARLGISERTAKFHVQQIMTKLGAENRAQAVALAARRRIV